ncbi:MAG: gliding motility lipoprotein GldD [Paludibacter sp.]|nr:gliding motility lipoprotein GldD [Paludibacter sp.]
MSRIKTDAVKIMFFVLALICTGCAENYFPKPYGYFRVDLPEHRYKRLETSFPCTFEIAAMAKPEIPQQAGINIVYPALNATIYCNYQAVSTSKIQELAEDARKAVYKHLIKADDIKEVVYENREKKVYGTFYDLKGNVASVAQFVLTDSSEHFFRGAVYFNNVPNKDSIAPMADYIKKDVIHLMESFSWK